MNEIYGQPDSDLGIENGVELTFSSLGIWRKIYLAFNWLISIGMAVLFLSAGLGLFEGKEVNLLFAICFAVFFIGQSLWLHIAVCKRNLSHLLLIAFIQLVPFFNPIAVIIVFAVRSTSKKELMLREPKDPMPKKAKGTVYSRIQSGEIEFWKIALAQFGLYLSIHFLKLIVSLAFSYTFGCLNVFDVICLFVYIGMSVLMIMSAANINSRVFKILAYLWSISTLLLAAGAVALEIFSLIAKVMESSTV